MTTHSKPQQPETSFPEQEELHHTITKVLQQAESYQISGQTKVAEDHYRALLEILPNHPDANHNLGVLLSENDTPAAALPYFRAAVSSTPACEQYWLSYINALILSGQIAGARQALDLGVRHGLKSNTVEELESRLLSRHKEPEEADALQQDVVLVKKTVQPAEDPSHSKGSKKKSAKGPTRQDIKKLAGLRSKGRITAIETFARDLTARYPNHGLGWKTLGSVLAQQGLTGEAIHSMQKAVILFPEDPTVHNDLGLMLYNKSQFKEAELHFNKALEIEPNFTAALSNLGNQFRIQGRLAEAEESFLQAIKFESNAILYNNLGATLLDLGRIIEAENSFRQAMKINPRFGLARINLGVCLRKQGRLVEAIDHQYRAVKLDPRNTELRSNLLFSQNYATNTASFLLEEARQFGKIVEKKVSRKFTSWNCAARPERLRVGIVSGDLHNHPVGFFLENVLKNINSKRVELIAYPTNPKKDDLTERIKACCVDWKPLFGRGDEDASRLVHGDGVHVLLDLSGHTSHNRLPMFAWKPAPIQVSWLGYFATTGVAEMDFFLADEVGVPASQQENFTETVWYLPETRLCFSAPNFDIPVAPLPAIKNRYITFGCFQLLTKVGDDVLLTWSSILDAIPDARLRWQCPQFNDPSVINHVEDRLQHCGINLGRVTLHGSMSRPGYLAAHAEVDLLLDTFPFPGGTTTCEALWMGVPTVSLAGNSLISRQGASVLSAAGLKEWVASSKKEYVNKAVIMAGDHDKLSSLRSRLRSAVLKTPIFNSEQFARRFEETLWQMWEEKKPKENLLALIGERKTENETGKKVNNQEKPVMNFFNPVFWGTKDPELFADLMRRAADLTTAYHFGDNMFLFQRNNSMFNDQPFMESWENNVITPPDRTIIWRRYILAMAGFHCQHLEGDFVECGAYQGVGAKTVIDYLGGKNFKKTFWLYDLFEHKVNSVNHAMQAHGPQLHGQVVTRFKDYQNVKIFKGFLPDVLEQGCPEKIAYLHLDLNQAPAEIATLDALFERVVPGGMIILDDYEMVFYRAQKLAEDTWFGKRGYKVFPLPTSQGFVIKR